MHKYAPKFAIVGNMGWESCEVHWKICKALLWNWLFDIDESRLTRQIFNWDKQIIVCWSKDICTLFWNSLFIDAFFNNEKINISLFRESVFAKDRGQRANDIWTNQNRSLTMIKTENGMENIRKKIFVYNLSKKIFMCSPEIWYFTLDYWNWTVC